MSARSSVVKRAPRQYEDADDLSDVQAGDLVIFLGVPHLITRVEPYDPTLLGYPGERWKTAIQDRPGRKDWRITVPLDSRRARG